jgi:triphosphoribosyl-dephospho-CoA synthetase
LVVRDGDLLRALKDERDHKIFAARAEEFCRRYAPDDPREAFEFTAALMSLFRDMILTQGIVHQQVAAHYFDQTMRVANAAPTTIIIQTEGK